MSTAYTYLPQYQTMCYFGTHFV